MEHEWAALHRPGAPDLYPEPAAVSGVQATSVTRLDPTVKIPYSVQYGIGVERQLRKSTTLTINYFGIRGVDMFRSRDVNAPAPPFYLARPNPNFSVIRQLESSADLQSHSLEIGLRGNVTRDGVANAAPHIRVSYSAI